MRISTAIRSWIARTIGGSSTAARWVAGADIESTGGAVMTDPYSQAGVVYGCVQALAENLANIPLQIGRAHV